MSSWFILRDSKEHGPFSASHLKEMAKSGGLVKSDKSSVFEGFLGGCVSTTATSLG